MIVREQTWFSNGFNTFQIVLKTMAVKANH